MIHSKKCLARAVISVVENVRDEDGMTDARFQNIVERYPGRFSANGLSNLEDGTSLCVCGQVTGQCAVCGSSATQIRVSDGLKVCPAHIAVCAEHRRDPCPICDGGE